MTPPPQIQLYQDANGALEIVVDTNHDNIWLTQDQLSMLFQKDRTVISKHIKNIYKEQELEENQVCAFFARTAEDGKTYQVLFYNLDMILSVGYRTNSKQATKFRQWANMILKNYLVKGYSLNQKLLERQNDQVLEIHQTLDFLVKNSKVLPNQNQFLEILEKYTQSLVVLNQYDEDRIVINDKATSVKIEIADFLEVIANTKAKLTAQSEATELFGQAYEGKFDGSIGAVYQSFGGQDVYPTLEQKAANLLYLVIKNHSFADGNKRIGSILFIYFLAKNKFLHKPNGQAKIDENTLVALALLIAQSKPEDKEIMVKLVIRLIQE